MSRTLSQQIKDLEAERDRLLAYIGACRIKFGDAKVNQAILEFEREARVVNAVREPVDWRDVFKLVSIEKGAA